MHKTEMTKITNAVSIYTGK